MLCQWVTVVVDSVNVARNFVNATHIEARKPLLSCYRFFYQVAQTNGTSSLVNSLPERSLTRKACATIRAGTQTVGRHAKYVSIITSNMSKL